MLASTLNHMIMANHFYNKLNYNIFSDYFNSIKQEMLYKKSALKTFFCDIKKNTIDEDCNMRFNDLYENCFKKQSDE